MEIDCEDKRLRHLLRDPTAVEGYSAAIVKRFHFVVRLIIAAADERDFNFLPGLRFEKLQGKRAHQHSFRLNDQWRLIVEIRGKVPHKTIGIIAIEDYH